MASTLGYEGTLTIGTAYSNIKDVTVNMSASQVDDTTRNTNGWTSSRAGLRSWSVDFDIVASDNDTIFGNIRDAFTAGTSLTCSVADGHGNTISGTVYVTKFDRNEPLDGVVTYSVTLVGNGEPTVS